MTDHPRGALFLIYHDAVEVVRASTGEHVKAESPWSDGCAQFVAAGAERHYQPAFFVLLRYAYLAQFIAVDGGEYMDPAIICRHIHATVPADDW